jgi:hypothetical protein
MKWTALILTLALLAPGDAPKDKPAPRKPHPFAPSLPLLTDEEEAKLDQIIDRFIQYDLGKLKGDEGKKALQDFQRLGPEAIPALIRGLNRAAQIEATCPAVVIARKLGPLLLASNDPKLLEFARDNIGAGVTRSRHMAVLKDLKFACLRRRTEVVKAGRTSPGTKAPSAMSVTELADAVASERGDRLKQVLGELEKRNGNAAIAALGTAAGITYDEDAAKLARDLLLKNLLRQNGQVVKDRLKDERPEVRAAAATVVGKKGWRLGGDLIALLEDKDAEVRQAARQALVQLSKGMDHGPERDANDAQRAEAVSKWKAWWAKQGSR